jgi:hypothetical protein
MTFIGQLKKHFHLFKDGFFRGIGWAFGVTVGFVIVSTLLVVLLRSLGGLPLIGQFLATIVESTNESLIKRTPIINE